MTSEIRGFPDKRLAIKAEPACQETYLLLASRSQRSCVGSVALFRQRAVNTRRRGSDRARGRMRRARGRGLPRDLTQLPCS